MNALLATILHDIDQDLGRAHEQAASDLRTVLKALLAKRLKRHPLAVSGDDLMIGSRPYWALRHNSKHALIDLIDEVGYALAHLDPKTLHHLQGPL